MKNILFLITIMFFSVGLSAQNCQTAGDSDGDGLCNDIDPCPNVANPNPVDGDGDGVYNACDNCIAVANADQVDIDGDGIGDACDPCIDPDLDTVCGANDKCPGEDDRIDIDMDGIPDGCDTCIDVDRDDICDDEDDCISTNAGQSCDDGNPCTVNDLLDQFCICRGTFIDADSDGVCDLEDQCPGYDDTADFDGDGIPDGCDESATCTSCTPDEEGKIQFCHIYGPGRVGSFYAECQYVEVYFDNLGNFINEGDHCGPCNCADEGDVDTDGDGICDKNDPCPDDATITEDNGCGCDDQDSDGDGVCDSEDACPGEDDRLDGDGDGVPDACDNLEYCNPQYDATMEWIASITINDHEFKNSEAASLYLHDEGIQLEKGKTQSLNISSEHIDDICELSYQVWVDWNQDGNYEDHEVILVEKGLEDASATFDVDDIEPGAYRARVMVHYGRITDACQGCIQGEVEDFLFDVVEVQACQSITEHFDYDMELEIDGANGGAGWTGAWKVNMEDEASQVAVLEGSLNSGAGNKIGILNAGQTEVNIIREIGASLLGSSELYFRIHLMRKSGSGQTNISLGDIQFGINSSDEYYIEDQVTGMTAVNEAIELLGKIVINHEGEDEVLLWVDPSSDNPDAGDAMSANVEVGEELSQLTIAFISEDNFVPLVHYVDGIEIGCDGNFVKRKKETRATSRSGKKESDDNATVSISQLVVYPNPVNNRMVTLMVKGKEAVYQYTILDTAGHKVRSGQLLAGANRISSKNLSSGMYQVLVEGSDQLLRQKLIITK